MRSGTPNAAIQYNAAFGSLTVLLHHGFHHWQGNSIDTGKSDGNNIAEKNMTKFRAIRISVNQSVKLRPLIAAT